MGNFNLTIQTSQRSNSFSTISYRPRRLQENYSKLQNFNENVSKFKFFLKFRIESCKLSETSRSERIFPKFAILNFGCHERSQSYDITLQGVVCVAGSARQSAAVVRFFSTCYRSIIAACNPLQAGGDNSAESCPQACKNFSEVTM